MHDIAAGVLFSISFVDVTSSIVSIIELWSHHWPQYVSVDRYPTEQCVFSKFYDFGGDEELLQGHLAFKSASFTFLLIAFELTIICLTLSCPFLRCVNQVSEMVINNNCSFTPYMGHGYVSETSSLLINF